MMECIEFLPCGFPNVLPHSGGIGPLILHGALPVYPLSLQALEKKGEAEPANTDTE